MAIYTDLLLRSDVNKNFFKTNTKTFRASSNGFDVLMSLTDEQSSSVNM